MEQPRRARHVLPYPGEIARFKKQVERLSSPPPPPREIERFKREFERFYTPRW